MTVRRSLELALLVAIVLCHAGCGVAQLVGGMAQNYEYEKKVQRFAEYDDLEGRSVAVVVDADMATLYEHPHVIRHISENVAGRLNQNVPDIRVMNPQNVLVWQHRTPQWNAMPYGEIAEELNVDRVVYIELYEYRLHPPGNRWEWDGVCAGSVGIIERGSILSDSFSDQFNVVGRFPGRRGIAREDASADRIEMGVLHEFIQQVAWLFHEHEAPKYPDRYRGR
ncbi:MAG: hypothetical protein EA377_13620 [Phycisphaerales bacterium]|nr:MAG: hypothetical protein EA377_13620 [Phycisphaerales bacterium]